MAIPRSVAVKLLNASEYRLYEASRRGHVNDHSPERLKQLVATTRKHADKQRERARQQKGEVRGKRAPRRTQPAKGYEGTQSKQQIFEEMLARFEGALERKETAGGNGAAKPRSTAARRTATERRAAAAKRSRVAARKGARGELKAANAARAAEAPAPEAASNGAAEAPVKRGAKKIVKAPAAAPAAAKKGSGGGVTPRPARDAARMQRKKQQAAGRSRAAHATARGRRTQAKRDRG